ncbi:tyrosine-type recombinase/integrase [Nocardia sp. NPDC004711]
MPLFPRTNINYDLTLFVSSSTFREPFNRWLEGLGLSSVTSHQTRATLTTSLLNNGAPPALVRQLLGHAFGVDRCGGGIGNRIRIAV